MTLNLRGGDPASCLGLGVPPPRPGLTGDGGWVGMAAVARYFGDVITAPGYPKELCFFHCLRACAAWRAYVEASADDRTADGGTDRGP